MKHTKFRYKRNTLSLTSILKEIKREQKRALKSVTSYAYSSLSLSEIINSGALQQNETYALNEFFKYYNNGNIPLLNENNIKRISDHIYTLNEYSLNEGWNDWIKSVGSKATEWLSSGWESVKKIWKNFTDLIKKIVAVVSEGFKKLVAEVMKKVNSIKSALQQAFDKQAEKSKEHLAKHSPADITTEWNVITESVEYIANFVSKQFNSESSIWADQVIKGQVTPVGNTSVEENFKFDKSIISSLLNLNESFHIEDLLNKEKYPKAHKVVKWVLNAISWTFNPINTALKYLAKYIVGGWKEDGKSGILYWINLTAEALKGPKAIAYPILGFVCMEATEICLSGLNLSTHGKMLGALNVGIEAIDKLGINIWSTFHHLIELVPGLSTVVQIVEWICILYALGNFILNVFPKLIKTINPDLATAVH